MFDVQKVKDDCVQWIREFFEQNGKGCNAVVGISGGKDSSIVAAFCVAAAKHIPSGLSEGVASFRKKLKNNMDICYTVFSHLLLTD
jgi:NH3-dependent NAD+ synthetase